MKSSPAAIAILIGGLIVIMTVFFFYLGRAIKRQEREANDAGGTTKSPPASAREWFPDLPRWASILMSVVVVLAVLGLLIYRLTSHSY